jgi:hypothetical protein
MIEHLNGEDNRWALRKMLGWVDKERLLVPSVALSDELHDLPIEIGDGILIH